MALVPEAQPIGVEMGAVYTITGPDGTRAVIGPALGDPDWIGYLTTPPSGLERAAVRESADDLPEADGGVHGNFLYSRLAFTLSGIIPADHDGASWASRQARLLQATDAMRGDALLEWTPEEADPVRVAFRQQQPTRITGVRPKQFLVAGVSEDPVIYSQALHIEELLAAVGVGALGGFSSPLVSPLASAPPVAAVATLLNAGRAPSWPRITFFGPASGPSLINLENGRGIYLNWTLAAGEEIQVDTNPRRRAITLPASGQSAYRALDRARSRWWALASGYTNVRLGFTTYGPGAGARIEWRDAHG